MQEGLKEPKQKKYALKNMFFSEGIMYIGTF